MSVSKRTRYEVLRRDNNTCRYCGGSAPDVTLTIDHVTPVSLGGSDDPANLVAACKDCNAGKSSSNPDAPLVAAVSDDALRWAAALREVAERRAREQHDENATHDRFLDVWENAPCTSYKRPELPDNWWGSIRSILAAGLPEELLHAAVRQSFGTYKVSDWDKFRYMCGICWKQVTAIQDEARAALQRADGVTPACAHCLEDEEECWAAEEECPKCGTPGCPYVHGDADGEYREWRRTEDVVAMWKWGGDEPHRILMGHVDHRTSDFIERMRWVAA